MITIEFNGERLELAAALTLQQLLEQQQQSPDGIAVVLNGNIVSRSEWANTSLAELAKVKVFRAIAGG